MGEISIIHPGLIIHEPDYISPSLRIQIALAGIAEVGLGDVAHTGANFAEGEVALLADQRLVGSDYSNHGAEVVGEEVFQG